MISFRLLSALSILFGSFLLLLIAGKTNGFLLPKKSQAKTNAINNNLNCLLLRQNHEEAAVQKRSKTILCLSDDNDDSDDDTTQCERLSIEYCTGCRWQLRSFWMAQELLTTFNDANLNSVSFLPSKPGAPGGKFIITLYGEDNKKRYLWNREVDGGFPEIKQLKQLVRDRIAPSAFLGHSDTSEQQEQNKTEDDKEEEDTIAATPTTETLQRVLQEQGHVGANSLSITYCTGCKWLLRAAWFAQELLTTFSEEIDTLTLIPSRSSTEKPATFIIRLNEDAIWDRHEKGRFPEIKEIKQVLRDVLNPTKDLGHSDTTGKKAVEEMDDDEAEEARNYFGVA